MKTGLFSAMLFLGGLAFGKTITLNDDQKNDSNLISYFNFDTGAADTKSSISWDGNESFTWNRDGQYGTASRGNAPYKGSMMANTAFTISFDLNSFTSGTLLSLTTNDKADAPWRTVQLLTDDSGQLALTFGQTTKSTDITSTSLDWTTITLVGTTSASNNNTLSLELYANGVSQITLNVSGATNWVTGNNGKFNFQFGYYAVSSNNSTFDVDNVLIYNKALTATEVKALIEVPEPTTATLSLLALVGLAARRRRRMA
ncbi:MAG: LamG domain-containing protein [Akkermansia muciniphila]|nr:LamG domain-containing protein [Akkermansia muciniphila]